MGGVLGHCKSKWCWMSKVRISCAMLGDGWRIGCWVVAPIGMGRVAGVHIACIPVGL